MILELWGFIVELGQLVKSYWYAIWVPMKAIYRYQARNLEGGHLPPPKFLTLPVLKCADLCI